MDGQEHHLLAQYFGDADGIPKVLEQHGDSIAAGDITSGDENMPMPVFSFPSSATPAHIVPPSPSFGISSIGSLDPSSLQAGPEWHSSGQSPIFSGGESVPMASNPSLNSFNFHHDFGNDSHQADEEDVVFGNAYAESPVLTPQLSSLFAWDMVHSTNVKSEVDGFHHVGSGDQSSSSINAEALGIYNTGHSAGSYPDRHSRGAIEYHEAGVGLDAGNAQFGDTNETPKGRPQMKRAKTASRQIPSTSTKGTALSPTAPSTVAGSSRGSVRPGIGSKTRPATRASKAAANMASRVSEVSDDKKTRSTHNLVEKQYRNRLNAQFEGLMSSLPETLKLQGGNLEFGDGPNADAGERRISKAEVLDMARTHIQNLEQERDLLARERNELRGTFEKLKEEYARGDSAGGDIDDD